MRRKAVAIVFVVAAVMHGAAPHAQARVLERLQAGRQRIESRGVQSKQPADARDVRVLRRELLGRYIEDIDYVPDGPFAKHIVMLNGQEVHGLKAKAGSNAPIRKLFDLRQQVLWNPTGIAYVASEGLFAVVDGEQPTQLFFTDRHGRPHPPRPISYLNGYVPHWIEGLAYVPSTSPLFPDHLLTMTWNLNDYDIVRVQVIRRDGQVAAEIPLPFDISGLTEAYGIAFLAPDRLLVSSFHLLFLFDFDGNLLGRFAFENTNTLEEGIVQLADGRVVTGGAETLLFYDAALNRLPQHDRAAGTAVGLAFPTSVAWDPDRLEHLLLGREEIAPFSPFGAELVAAVPLSLNGHTTVLDLCCLSESFFYPRVAYMPDEHRIAVAGIGFETLTPQIGLFDNDGTFVEGIDASSIGVPGYEAIPVEIVYVPATSEFVLVDLYQGKKLKFLTRTGDLAREIDLAPMGIGRISALAYFNPLHPTGGQFLIFDYEGRAVITDFDGNPMREFDYREELGLTFVGGASAITNGPQAGAFTAFERASSAPLVVFTLE